MKIFLCFILLLTAAAMPEANAQIYKWKNKEGRTVYGDAPPAGESSAEKINLPDSSPPAQDASGPNTDWHAKEVEFQQRRISKAKSQINADKAEERRKQHCASLLRDKSFLQRIHGRRVASWNEEKGDYDFLTDEDRAAMEKRLSENLERYSCE
ncbi:MAG: DUF4124 domain-containing protein [Candidatus Accumulibacter sp.]|nr:DUF4124 domain-containing protein [Accumulibacter sp.]